MKAEMRNPQPTKPAIAQMQSLLRFVISNLYALQLEDQPQEKVKAHRIPHIPFINT
ncbi:hypothetical protein ACTXT7_017420 [Hymenolepis weldensis]